MSHGMHNTPTYHTWENMKQRCLNPKHPSYADYGGRGITVCEEWLSFEGFFASMGKKPKGKTLERVDNNLGYFPENCEWATPLKQNSNQRHHWDSSTKCRGVHWASNGVSVVAQGMRKGKRFCLYRGPDLFEAVCARKSWEHQTYS